MTIEAVLFDADGVIQSRPSGWRRSLGERIGWVDRVDAFMADVFEVEHPALDGRASFADALPGVLERWKWRGSLEDWLDEWSVIEVSSEVVETIRALRRSGVACHLATNQEAHRASHMSHTLGYAELFDREFYSCRMGVVKPAAGYFRVILDETGLRPDAVLFLDDRADNVESARELGLHAVEWSLEAGPQALHRVLRAYGLAGDSKA